MIRTNAVKRSTRALSLALVLGLSAVGAVALAQDAEAPEAPVAAEPAAEQPAAEQGPGPKLVKPWSGMDSLDADQRRQINRIHKDALKKIRDVKEQEEQDILALLTDDQKAEYEMMMEDGKAKKPKKAEEAAQ